MDHRPHRGIGRPADHRSLSPADERRALRWWRAGTPWRRGGGISGHRIRLRPFRSWARAAIALGCLVPVAAGCAPTVMEGRAASMLYDPDRVGGLHATRGLSGVRPDAPEPQGDVEGTDGGDDDRLALLAVNDIQDFWAATYPQFFSGEYTPVSTLRSYDSTNPLSPRRVRQNRHLWGTPMRRTAFVMTRSRGIAAFLSLTRASTLETSTWSGCSRTSSATLCSTKRTWSSYGPARSSRSSRPTASPGSICTG